MKKDTNNKILAIIYSDQDKFLLLRTNPKTMKVDHWYVVTGGIKEDEKAKDAVIREVDEETELSILKIKSTKLSFDYEWPINSGKMKHEEVFIVKVKHADPKITKYEHLDWKWLNKKDFLDKIYWYGDSKDNLKKIIEKLK
jgi:NADH pyrophosphatase NudC (nudix superfamily)